MSGAEPGLPFPNRLEGNLSCGAMSDKGVDSNYPLLIIFPDGSMVGSVELDTFAQGYIATDAAQFH